MKKSTIYVLAFVFILIVILKIVLSTAVTSPGVFTDEYLYSKMAQSVFQEGNLDIHGNQDVQKYLPLYPAILSLAYFFSDPFVAIKIINAILSTLVLFPLFILAKEFLSEKKALIGATLVSLFAANFNITNYIMAENLFFFLFILEIVLLYFAFKTQEKKYFFLSGIILGLGYWTKASGMILIPVAFLVFLIYRKKFTNIIIHYVTALIVVIPIIMRNLSFHGATTYAVTSGYGGPIAFLGNTIDNPLGLLNWIILYLGYTIIGSGILFGIYYFSSYPSKDKKFNLLLTITGITFLVNLFIVANQANGSDLLYNSPLFPLFSNRPIGRYLDPSVSLVMLTGFIAFLTMKIKEKRVKVTLLFSSLILFVTAQLTIAPLFPVNNQSLTLIGLFHAGLQYIFDGQILAGFTLIPFLIVAITLALIPLFIYAFRRQRKLLYFLAIFFILLTTVAAFTITTWNSQTNWGSSDQQELGKQLDNILKPNDIVGIDLESCNGRLHTEEINEILCDNKNGWSLVGFWIQNEIRLIEDVENLGEVDYLVSNRDLSYSEILKEGNFIVYDV
jgi:hypothetical protein